MLTAHPVHESISSFFSAFRHARQARFLCAHFNRKACMTFQSRLPSSRQTSFGVRAPLQLPARY